MPGRAIPTDPEIEAAVRIGEQLFQNIGCSGCHVPKLPLDKKGWIYSEPNPFNPKGNLQTGNTQEYKFDFTEENLDQPRLKVEKEIVWVPAFTDLKLHDITSGPGDPNREPIDQNALEGSTEFFAGNSHFMTRKLWGTANEPPYFHHGQYTTMRQAIEAHRGEAYGTYVKWAALSEAHQNSVNKLAPRALHLSPRQDHGESQVEFLKTLQILPEGTNRPLKNYLRCRCGVKNRLKMLIY